MTRLAWDQVGEKIYQLGIDRGVLYTEDAAAVGYGVPWNGIVSIDELASETTNNSVYFDGQKYLVARTLGDFSARLKAFTYPDEFLEFDGVASIDTVQDVITEPITNEMTGLAPTGMYVYDQPVTRYFGLSYRSKVGDDVLGSDRGYKLHLAYNLSASPSDLVRQTISSADVPMLLEWNISGIPVQFNGYRPTAHVVLDTESFPAELREAIENILYGTDINSPRLPSPDELKDLISGWSLINIIDNGDGTWSAIGPDDLVFMTSSTSFQINEANATYLDGDTYQIQSN